MGFWTKLRTLDQLNQLHGGTLPQLLGIEFIGLDDVGLRARMPVDARHVQPFGILHGGASVVLAESVGSLAGWLALPEDQLCVGLEVSASHLAAVRAGDSVTALARPVRLGRTVQVWQIDLTRGDGTQTCACRLTTAVRPVAG
jgi:uncharacterized protein (TIGR00369 family)